MSTSFKVTPSILASQANGVNELNGRFKTAVANLVSAEASLNSMWDGEANDAFHNAFIIDKGKMDEFYKLVCKYVESLNTIATRYRQTEQTNTDIAKTRRY